VITLFGIKNCDTVKKARRWLADNDIQHAFHDVRADGLQLEQIAEWIAKTDWEIVLNRRGTTWRKLDASIQENTSENSVAELLLANPAMIKRPILDVNGVINIGFTPQLYHSIFNSIK
jgi:arsenate reductase